MSGVKKLETIEYKGTKNKTVNKKFISLCKKSQKKLKSYLVTELNKFYTERNIIIGDGFLYARGTQPVLLTAHLDTVHDKVVKDYYEDKTWNQQKLRFEHTVSSPQGIGGDDRCGVYMILEILGSTNYRPSILFCEDEEIGGVGSNKFVYTKYCSELKEMKFFLELDRCNGNDAVFYNCGNNDFQEFIMEKGGYEYNTGSFSDISVLSPATDVASVNLSCGYYYQHTLAEYVNLEEMEDSIDSIIAILDEEENAPAFDYQEDTRKYGWLDYDWGSTYSRSSYYGLEFDFIGEDGKDDFDYIEGESFEDCMCNFFMDHPTVCYNDIIDLQEVKF